MLSHILSSLFTNRPRPIRMEKGFVFSHYGLCKVWAVHDSKDYILPQRRNRVWGIVALNNGKNTESDIDMEYKACMEAMKSNFRFDLDSYFPPAPEMEITNSNHQALVEAVRKDSFGNTDMYVDCSTSLGRRMVAQDAVPCITPTHPYFSLRMNRYLSSVDLMNSQGLWQSAFSADGYQHLLDNPTLAQSFTGNSFSGPVVQSVFLSSLICCQDAWKTVPSRAETQNLPVVEASECQERASQVQEKGNVSLQRIRKKRKAPEYDQLSGPPASATRPKKKKRNYKRKTSGEDSRKGSSGKKCVATIWDKEQLFGPQLLECKHQNTEGRHFCICLMRILSYSIARYIYNIYIYIYIY